MQNVDQYRVSIESSLPEKTKNKKCKFISFSLKYIYIHKKKNKKQ